MSAIKEVLQRRSDLATFVVHFTRRSDAMSAEQNLVQMLVRGCIEARNPMGWARRTAEELGSEVARTQSVVCFSEAPLEHFYSLTADIDGRRVALEPYGIAFTKMVARRKGANPVWYVDMSRGHDWDLARSLDRIRDDLKTRAIGESRADFARHPAAVIFPFIEQMGTWSTSQKEFWWEREWRKLGDFTFASSDIALIVAPEDAHAVLRREFSRPVVDAAWGLERMIASLAHVPESDLTPFS
jgi:hypothetical protein